MTNTKNDLEIFVENHMRERAILMDRELFKLLDLYDIKFESVPKLKDELKQKGFEIIIDESQTFTETKYTFKLCRLLGTHSFSIPKITI